MYPGSLLDALFATVLAAGCSPAVLGQRTDQFQLRGDFVVDTDFFVRGQLQPGETLDQFIQWVSPPGGVFEPPLYFWQCCKNIQAFISDTIKTSQVVQYAHY